MGQFLDKPKVEKHNERGQNENLRYGIGSMQGWRIEMEDAHAAILNLDDQRWSNWSYFGIFDGHAGFRTAIKAAEKLHSSVLSSLNNLVINVNNSKSNSPISSSQLNFNQFEAAIKEAYFKFDSDWREENRANNPEDQSGSTAISCLIDNERIFFLNVGDSRGILVSTEGRVLLATKDHKPSDPNERQRIEDAGGNVLIQRVNGSLAVSRALGDFEYKNNSMRRANQQLVSAEPEIIFHERNWSINIGERDEQLAFIALACDGIWDVMSNEELAAYILARMRVNEDLTEIANSVLDMCLYKGSKDNMSLIIIAFKTAPQVIAEWKSKDELLENEIRKKTIEIVHRNSNRTSPDTNWLWQQVVNALSEQSSTKETFQALGGFVAKRSTFESVLESLTKNSSNNLGDESTNQEFSISASMEPSILQDESFEEFLSEDFDIKSFSATILQTKIVTDYLQHLNDLIRTIDGEIKQQVSTNAPVLFRQATSIGTIEDVLENMQSRIGSLKATVDRISTKISEPYETILTRKHQLTRLQNTCDLLRRIKGILQQTKKLQSFMSPNSSGQPQIELIKASHCLSELDHFTVDADFTGIEIVEKDLQFIFKARHDIQNQAQEALENGLQHLNPTLIGTGLQVFFNLSTLEDRVQSIEQRLFDDFQNQLTEFLDMKQLSKSKDPTNPGRTTMPNIGNTPQFRVLLWTNIEKILDLIYNYVAQLSNLSKVLTKKKDPITHASFLDQLIKRGHSGDLIGRFWVSAIKSFRQKLKQAASDSFHLRQALEGEYPKLLKLQNDLVNRLNQLHPTFHELDMDSIDDEENVKQKAQWQLNQCSEIFEKAYLSISLSRLSDPINLMFTSSTTKSLPNQQELENLIKLMINELSVSAVSENLVDKIARNVSKSIQLFSAKCEQSICTDSEGSQVVSAPTPAQLRNIAAINILYNFSSMINKMLNEQQNLPASAVERINGAQQSIHSLMRTAIHPFLNSVVDCIEAILVTMHNEDFSQTTQNRGESQTSLYMKELQEFILRIQKDYFNEFQCKDFMYENLAPIASRAIILFLQHISLVRPLSESGLLRLVVDFAQIELALSPFCRRLIDLGKHYKILKAFRSLLVLNSEEFLSNSAVGEVVPYDLVLHHLFSRAPSDLRSPHQVMNWSISRYIQWLDEHPNLNDRLIMIKGTVDTYVQMVRNRQQKEFAPIYVVILNILEKGLAANA